MLSGSPRHHGTVHEPTEAPFCQPTPSLFNGAGTKAHSLLGALCRKNLGVMTCLLAGLRTEHSPPLCIRCVILSLFDAVDVGLLHNLPEW